jgi:hypothetical protein
MSLHLIGLLLFCTTAMSAGQGGLYSDEGSTNWNMSGNVVQTVMIWLQGCRPGCETIGPNWQDDNW